MSTRDITPGMKMAATKALAALAKEPVPDYITHAYAGEVMQYVPEYIIPKPFDRRVLIWEAADVAEAAVMEGIAALSRGIRQAKVQRIVRSKTWNVLSRNASFSTK